MVIPFRRTIWSGSTVSSTAGADRVFVTLWSGLRADVAGFRMAYWALGGQHNGVVKRTPAAQASKDGASWVDVTLDPASSAEEDAGWFGPDVAAYALTNWRYKYLRIGLKVEARDTPTGSVFQTVEGVVTLVGEAL